MQCRKYEATLGRLKESSCQPHCDVPRARSHARGDGGFATPDNSSPREWKEKKATNRSKRNAVEFCRSSVEERGVEYKSKFKFWNGDEENDNTCFQVSKWRSCSKHISEIVVCGPSLNHCMLKPRNTVIGPSDLAVFSRQSSVLSYSTPRPVLIILALAVLFMHWIFSLSLCGAWKWRNVACTTSDVKQKFNLTKLTDSVRFLRINRLRHNATLRKVHRASHPSCNDAR